MIFPLHCGGSISVALEANEAFEEGPLLNYGHIMYLIIFDGNLYYFHYCKKRRKELLQHFAELGQFVATRGVPKHPLVKTERTFCERILSQLSNFFGRLTFYTAIMKTGSWKFGEKIIFSRITTIKLGPATNSGCSR